MLNIKNLEIYWKILLIQWMYGWRKQPNIALSPKSLIKRGKLHGTQAG